jgi:hypothetical protein
MGAEVVAERKGKLDARGGHPGPDPGPDGPHWLQSALAALRVAVEGLRAAAAAVDGALEEVDRLAMPNSRRAEQQLRIALNASLGAERSLRRRFDLERAEAERRRRGRARESSGGPEERPGSDPGAGDEAPR